jgi:hypothetical protein
MLADGANNILKNSDIYKQLKFNRLLIIDGMEVIKENQILPISTLYLENEDGNVLFVADYCSKSEVEKLKDTLCEKLDINDCKRFNIVSNPKPEFNQQMLAYLIYANPDLRPIIYGNSISINDKEINIKDNKILVDGEELTPEVFLQILFNEDDSDKKKIVISEIQNKKDQLLLLITYLTNIEQILQNPSVVPKMVDIEGKKYQAILYRNKNGKYVANVINGNNFQLRDDFSISANLSWDDIIKTIKDLGSIKEDIILKKIIQKNTETRDELSI